MLPKILPTTYLLSALIFAFIWTSNPLLSKFSFQLTALLVLIFIFHNWWRKHQLRLNPSNKSILINRNISNAILLTMVVTMLILHTKGASSPLFFLLDFMLLGISLFFEPMMSLILALALIVGFLLNSPLNNTQELTNLISLLFMAPLAAFFSSQYLSLLVAKNKIKVLQHQAKSLNKALDTEESDTLLWLSLNFHQTMTHTLDWFSQMGGTISKLPYHQQQQFSQLYQDMKVLFQSGEQLKEKIDRLTDD
jgi:hypothetical protein